MAKVVQTDHRATLAKIKRFDQLIAYLRDEMGWPIARDSFEDVDDLFYDFTADELGIDPKTAAKIESIRRLRPLSVRQPWGIFFVKFEPKKLPIVALRRILGQVALKKRASANSAERAAWAADDLLFISNYGEGEERQISFAHFSKARDSRDLPTLKVLGWNNLNTALHLDAVASELTENLAWPEDDADIEAWRERWRAAFTLRHREVVTTSKDLSIRLAELARAIRDRTKAALTIETESGPLTKLMTAFREALVHDLDANGFADMYAQTIAYGLLSARITDPHKKTADDFAGHMRTNPFLRELMETFLKAGGRHRKAGGLGIDFDELGVNDVVELLDDANMEAVVRDFGDRNPQEDPVIHFYELFLKEYDAKMRMQRGVFYTPRPVVSFIVRSVDEQLRTEFGLEDGLADTTTWGEVTERYKDVKIPEGTSAEQTVVQILDPATGTGTFLVEVIDLIHKTLVAKWKAQGHGEKKIEALWNEYVPKHLLPRLHGYEVLMAPYAIAHLKIGLKLYETGYGFGSDERARVYLTNALEPASDSKKQMEFGEWLPALAHEAEAVNGIKRKQQFSIVIGNPPYSINSCNLQESAVALVEPFRYVDGEKIKERGALKFETILQDDYVKFWGLGVRILKGVPIGIISMISNNGYLTNRVLRGVRKTFLDNFNRLSFLDLHGNRIKGEVSPDGSPDHNVFEINQGVGIALLRKTPGAIQTDTIEIADMWGNRDFKYRTLSESSASRTAFQAHAPRAPYYTFALVDKDIEDEYRSFVALDEAMPFNKAGFVTGRDEFAVDFDIEPLKQRINDFLDPRNSDSAVRERYFIKDAGGYQLARRRRPALAAKLKAEDIIRRVQHRPFDYRFVAYSDAVLTSPQRAVMQQLIAGDNLAFCLARGSEIMRGWEHIFCTRALVQHHTVSLKEVNYVFPLRVSVEEGSLALGMDKSANFAPQFLRAFVARLRSGVEGTARLPREPASEEIFEYAYAVFFSPEYRERYAEFLKVDFPRLPLPRSLELFRDLAHLGNELVALHLMESPKLDSFVTTCTGPKNPEVDRVGWSDNTVWLDAASTKKGQPSAPGTVGFRGVPEAVWNFHIGGYQVCEKWLKDRKGRTLSKDDIAHYQRIVVALSETIRLMKEIDVAIGEYGGWPAAFVLDGVGAQESAEGILEETSNAVTSPVSHHSSGYQEELLPLQKVAEPRSPHYDAAKNADLESNVADPRQLDREDLICRIRQMLGDGAERSRDTAINELARDLGYDSPHTHTREEIGNALRAASRRGIVANERGIVRASLRTIEQYDRNFLKEQFLASLSGRQWIERDESIRSFARWMGFRRTGPSIEETARSLINGLLREARLESDGSRIRRTG